jgi:TRAP-type mannitol/chloroaromatic compound transport system permease large subunit
VLQASFMLPPMGYAILMARARSGFAAVPTQAIFKEILPYVSVVALFVAIVFAVPKAVHWLDKPQPIVQESDKPSEADIVRQMEEMGKQVAPN